MKIPNSIQIYFLFKTTAPDGSAFFGIHRSTNLTWGGDGIAVNYIGNGPKLAAKARKYGIDKLKLEVLYSDPSYDVIKARLDAILTPATLADPRCLNMPLPVRNAKISESMKGLPKSPEHKVAIALAMAGNQNAAKVEEQVEEAAIVNTNDLRYVHNKETGEELQLLSDEELLTGFEEGRLPKELKSKFVKNRKKVLSDAERARMIADSE